MFPMTKHPQAMPVLNRRLLLNRHFAQLASDQHLHDIVSRETVYIVYTVYFRTPFADRQRGVWGGPPCSAAVLLEQ